MSFNRLPDKGYGLDNCGIISVSPVTGRQQRHRYCIYDVNSSRILCCVFWFISVIKGRDPFVQERGHYVEFLFLCLFQNTGGIPHLNCLI